MNSEDIQEISMKLQQICICINDYRKVMGVTREMAQQ